LAELALDDDQRDAFAGHLDRVGVAQLMWREATPHSCRGRRSTQLRACRCGRPVPSAHRAVDDAQKRTDRQPTPYVEPGLELLLSPGVHADLATAPALAAPDQDGAAALIKVAFRKHERILDAQAGSPQQHDKPAQATAMLSVPGGAHYPDGLFDLWRIGRVRSPLLPGA
jgi:hypothetical protein